MPVWAALLLVLALCAGVFAGAYWRAAQDCRAAVEAERERSAAAVLAEREQSAAAVAAALEAERERTLAAALAAFDEQIECVRPLRSVEVSRSVFRCVSRVNDAMLDLVLRP